MEVSSKRGRFALALVFGCSVAVLVCLFAAGRLPAEWHDLPAKLAVLVFAVWGFRRVRQCWPHPSPNVGRLTAEAALAGLLNPLAGNAFAIAMTLILLRFGAHPSAGSPTEMPTVSTVAAMFLVQVVLTVLGEELLCRGAVLPALLAHGEKQAIAVSALAFGMLHLFLLPLPWAIVLGVMSGVLFVRSGSLWPSLTLHAVGNTLGVLLALCRPLADLLRQATAAWTPTSAWWLAGAILVAAITTSIQWQLVKHWWAHARQSAPEAVSLRSTLVSVPGIGLCVFYLLVNVLFLIAMFSARK